MTRMLWWLLVSALCGTAVSSEGEPVGQRPYEMEWAGRTEDCHPPLVDFEDLAGWSVTCRDAKADFTCSRDQQLWGSYVGKLVYRGSGNQPSVLVQPPSPIPLPQSFDCLNFWVWGNNWAWAPDPTTPQVEIAVILSDAQGRTIRLPLGRVRWKEWWVMHAKLSPAQIAGLASGAALQGIEVSGGRNTEDRTLYFDNLSVYQEELPPLEFAPRPQRNLTLFPGQTGGTNTGPGKLPFPTREETILPDNLTEEFDVQLKEQDGVYIFSYAGRDGQLVYRYRPATGTLGDVTAQWVGRGEPFQPLAEGGLYFAGDGADYVPPEQLQLVSCRREGETVESVWRCTIGSRTVEAKYTFRLWQKSLVVDVACLGGEVGEFRVGRAAGVENPRLVTLPYLTGEAQRPAVLVLGPVEQPLFVFSILDHYRTNASSLWAANQVTADGVTYNGGSRYVAKTDGQRNDCFERLFLTISPRLEEVLPNVPNPPSPWMHVAGERVWIAYGASDRQRNYEFWKNIARYGMSKIAITDHEVGWRDGGESFTFRTRAAPGKGGDQGQREYARQLRELGFRYGIYNNYTDYAPVNEYWDEDCVTRTPRGDWQTAWARCYNPKPARAVEFEALLAPQIQEKFQLDTAYCDVHTAVQPWRYCDFDARVPGAGTLAATFYAYGEIMLHQKQTWNGPVYSEGNNHWYYCGLTDGNYGQDQAAKLADSPWLVDFDLRKLHPLCCNFGMGNPGMFYGRDARLGETAEERERRLDRFLAATLAFGHTGFLVLEGGISNTVRSYFSLQQIHKHYAQETAVDIRYADDQGRLLDSSAAVATDAFRRSQITTRYSNGLVVRVNGHPAEAWDAGPLVLPPNGWHVQGTPELALTAFSGLVGGHRVDYVDAPEYLYADGRGRFTRFQRAACDGQLIAHKRQDGSLEVIPVGECSDWGISLEGRTATAVALDVQGKPLGPAATRLSRGLLCVEPVEHAFSYLLEPGEPPEISLSCSRREVVPGETVRIAGSGDHDFRIPPDAAAGQRIWQQFDGAWIDFNVVPLVDAELEIVGGLKPTLPPAAALVPLTGPASETGPELQLRLTSHLPTTSEATVVLEGRSRDVSLPPGAPIVLSFPFSRPQQEQVRKIDLEVRAGELTGGRSWWLKAEEDILPIAVWPAEFVSGQALRGSHLARALRDRQPAAEVPLDDKSGALAVWGERACGGVTKPSLFMHPPYKTGIGYAFATFGPLELPVQPAAALRCVVGKADGSDTGDGILFRVAVLESDGRESIVAEQTLDQHTWSPLEADLSRWAGRALQIKLISDVGPWDNSSGDWSCWSEMRIETLQPALGLSLHDQPVALRYEPGPHPVDDLTAETLRQARSAVLQFQALGLESSGRYISHGSLNGAALGPLPAAGGNETQGIWGEGQIALGPEAIAQLDLVNQLLIHNPGRDSFAVRRFWLEVELPDGQKCTSRISTTAYTQPPEWPHGEGEGIPFGKDIAVQIRF